MRFPRSRRWLPGLKGRCLEPTAVFQIKYEYVPSPGNHNLSWLATMGFYRRADVKIWRGPSDLRFSQATRPSQEKSSLLASARGSNFTYNVDQGGFSEDNLLSIDQRGFKRLIQAEAGYSDSGVSVTFTDGTVLTAEYAICTFSLGVLQNDDVPFHPPFAPVEGRSNPQPDDGK
ncbi:hypothetical protein EDB85DRAFT_1889923 [Lactarius pseudohatsudake]|nr:hypothetical protein EDB85DRAFT_1889923 [Lactarius pseudohatsudake]